jgi:hypothetical protein
MMPRVRENEAAHIPANSEEKDERQSRTSNAFTLPVLV